jgi:predicted DNA-binding transcriptional regulator AlpA
MSNIEGAAEPSLSIPELCKADGFSESYYYKMRARGLGPVETRIGSLIRITPKDRREWHKRLQALAQSEAAQLEAERRRAQRVAAGRASVRSPRHVNNAGRAVARGRGRS